MFDIMQFFHIATLLSLSLLPASLAIAIHETSAFNLTSQPTSPRSLPVKLIHEFPIGRGAENLAVRQNGQVLMTIIDHPELYQIDPHQGESAKLVSNSFGPVVGLLGIVETYPDTFYVAAGNVSMTTLQGTPGSFSVWKVDLESHHVPAPTTKIADFPAAGLLNGIALLSKEKGLILVADSTGGVIWRLNVFSGEVLRILDIPATHAPPSSVLPLGVNGLKIRNGTLYFTNSAANTLYRLPINADGTAAGNASVVAAGLYGADDFQFDDEGNAYVALHFAGELVKVTPQGVTTVLVNNITVTLPNPAAPQFGRTFADRGSLYISEGGNPTSGGRLSRVDVGTE